MDHRLRTPLRVSEQTLDLQRLRHWLLDLVWLGLLDVVSLLV